MIKTLGLDSVIPPEIMALATPEIWEEAMLALGDASRDYWVRLAGSELVTSRRDYQQGILPVEYGTAEFALVLAGQVPNIVENGQPSYDMHDTLLGPNVPVVEPGQRGKHMKKDGTGFYRHIPFRQATPDSAGQAGQPMGRPYGDTKKLGQSIYSIAKDLKPGQRFPAGMVRKLKASHKTDIYAGMVKEQKNYGKATQSKYMTFRTIATGSPGWIRKDTRPGKQLLNRVQQWIEQNAEANLSVLLEQL